MSPATKTEVIGEWPMLIGHRSLWLNKLNQFNGNFVEAEMVKAFITSDEYRTLLMNGNVIKRKVWRFALIGDEDVRASITLSRGC